MKRIPIKVYVIIYGNFTYFGAPSYGVWRSEYFTSKEACEAALKDIKDSGCFKDSNFIIQELTERITISE